MSKALRYSSTIEVDDNTKTLLVVAGVAAVGLLGYFYFTKTASAPGAANAVPVTAPGSSPASGVQVSPSDPGY